MTWLALAGAAQAQSQTAQGTIEVHRSLNVSTVAPLRVDLGGADEVTTLNAVLLDGPSLIEVRGDANRLYRIQVQDGAREMSLEIWSKNVGDISETRVGVMDANGVDLIRISGATEALRLMLERGGTIPLSIQYE